MKITFGFLSCLAILLCALTLTSLASEISHASRNRSIQVIRHVFRVEETNHEGEGARRGGKINLDTYGNEFELKSKYFIADVGKGQKGRGSPGGSNNFHHPRPYKSSAPSLKQPSIFTSSAGVIFILSLLLVFPLLIP